ncbi:MAG: RNA methyltransferase [Chitinophagaceae bacterium]|nr:RNA methyltransferase [Chitinophagaceae bacterium]
MAQNFTITVKTLFGFEDILANELKQLGGLNIQKLQRMVSVEGDEGFIYKVNLACRTAIKVLKPLFTFQAQTEKEFYDAIYAHNWNQYLDVEDTLAIDATVHSELFRHSKYIALLCKDAIVDQFRNASGSRPNVDPEKPSVRFNVHIQGSQCTLSIDSSGDSLHLRGYRSQTGLAPINEVLAAGLLMLSGWEGQCNFLDPMCGSGTVLIEAAMIANNIPCNIHRTFFAFQKWKSFDEALFETIKEGLLKKTREFPYMLYGYDVDFSCIKKSRINIDQAMLEDFINVKQQDFFTSKKESEGPLHIFFNPPYNERIQIDTEVFYQHIGSALKHGYPNSKAWLITSNAEALKCVGLKPITKIKTFNGALESRLVGYELYEGSRKHNPKNT